MSKSKACRKAMKNTQIRADLSSECGTGPISTSTAEHRPRTIWDFGLPRDLVEQELRSNRSIGTRHYGIPADQIDAWAEAECLKYFISWEAYEQHQKAESS